MIARWTLLVSGLLIATLTQAQNKAERSEQQIQWHLEDPIQFSLGLKPAHFRGRLKKYPSHDQCHTQGLVLIGEHLVMSCSMHANILDRRKHSRSLLLRARLGDIESGAPEIHWKIKDITLPGPNHQVVFGHPSGLFYDGKGIWVANSVYAPHSHSLVARYDPNTLGLLPDPTPIAISDHLGTLAWLSQKQILVGFNWDTQEAYRIQPAIRRVQKRESSLAVRYQDCDGLHSYLICSGETTWNIGWLDVLNSDLKVIDTIRWPLSADQMCKYPLTHEGFALSPLGDFAYFLPDDLPQAKLIRMKVIGTSGR